MESKHVFLAALYLLPYLAGVLMPGWWTLGAYAVVAAGFGVWAFRLRAPGGLARTIEKSLFGLLLLGAGAGIATRLLIFAAEAIGAPDWLNFVLAGVGAVAVPAWFFGRSLLRR